jgi:transmembrane sensor
MEPENPDTKYLQLAEKWMNGTITPEEEKVFAQWYNEDQNKEIVLPGSFATGEETHSQRIWQRIQDLKAISESMRAIRADATSGSAATPGPTGASGSAATPESTGAQEFARIRERVRVWTPRVAASVLLVLVSAAAIWWFYSKSLAKQSVTGRLASDKLTIRPVGNRARLTLGDGSVVDLDAANEGLITADGKTQIDKQKAQLVYKAAGGAKAIPKVVYNTLTTPRGGMYSVVLSDGTKVWLNASSSLRYPTTFAGRVRAVNLTGEAYFEVAQNLSRPFKVVVNGMEVNVLGTHFNVMAYDDESAITTTLLEGAVKVNFKEHSITLAPGQQSLLMRAGEDMRVRDAEVDEAVAWKNGIFQFRSEDIKSVMRKIARWYDVDVKYEGEINEHFTGAVYRDADVSSLLRTMELTHEVQFHIEGRTITVSP